MQVSTRSVIPVDPTHGRCIYHPEGVSSRLDEGPHDLDDFSALLGLADRFNFGQLLRTIAADLEAATSELQPVGKDPALRLAIERDVYGWLHLALK